jgi:hypothetical protein
MIYYYADAMVSGDERVDPEGDTAPGTIALTCDKTRDPFRFVLTSPEPDPAWGPKTAEEVEADYPGLIGGE